MPVGNIIIIIVKIQYFRIIRIFLSFAFLSIDFFSKKIVHAITILYSVKILKIDGKRPCNFLLKDESHGNSLTSWNQPSSDPEDLFTDSHLQVKLI